MRASVLFKNEYLTIACDRTQRILVITRSAKPFERVEEIDVARLALSRAFPESQRVGFSVLNDYRLAPVRVHPAHEPAFARFRAETELGFTCAAHVVASPVGRVRSDRLRGTGTLPSKMFQTFDEALTYLVEAQSS
ncbi:MAG: hypothetical protein QM756_33325 [Polyangiaceae bacterium]